MRGMPTTCRMLSACVTVRVVTPGPVLPLPNQAGVRAFLDDAAVIHHQDAVGMLHRGQPVRDHDRGAIRHQGRQPLLDLRFGVCRKLTACGTWCGALTACGTAYCKLLACSTVG